MASRSAGAPFAWLLAKEWRELVSSRAWWVMLGLMGPLVGFSFISAVRTYAELSGAGGSAEGVGEAFAPLIGVWSPTFSAGELAAAFLLPFVAIRVVAGDKQSGALKLELQQSMPVVWRIAAKALVLMAGWLVASVPAGLAVILWASYGGAVYPPEVTVVVMGHLLNAGLTIGLAAAAAALTEHPSTAAIVTLSVTIGTWMINFIAAVQGGVWEWLAAYTPTAMVAQFQHALVRLDIVLAGLSLVAAGLTLAAVWTRLGMPPRRKVCESVFVLAVTAASLFACSFVQRSWDWSEGRINSFRPSEELALRRILDPLRIEVHLAPEDPRRVDLEVRAIAKLKRVLPRVQVTYVSNSATGLFEQTRDHYGEIWYELNGFRVMSRSTTAEGVLEAISEVAGVGLPEPADDEFYRGHPLAVPPRRAGAVFYGIWPACVLAAGVWFSRRQA